MTVTEKLLSELNKKKGLSYPQVGYSYYADIKGDGLNNKRVYAIIGEFGGVRFDTNLNSATAKGRCDNIRQAIAELSSK